MKEVDEGIKMEEEREGRMLRVMVLLVLWKTVTHDLSILRVRPFKEHQSESKAEADSRREM